VPYDISNGNLVIGPYFKHLDSMPRDYHKRKMSIPIKMILTHSRVSVLDN